MRYKIKILQKFLCICMAVLLFTQSTVTALAFESEKAKYSYGEEKVIHVKSEKDLLNIPDGSTARYKMTKNIKLSGKKTVQISNFAGVFDGNGYKIYNYASNKGKALFHCIREDGTVKNLKLSGKITTTKMKSKDMDMLYGFEEDTIGNNVAMLADWSYGRITDCQVSGSITKKRNVGNNSVNVGGMVACNLGHMSNCKSTVNITYQSYLNDYTQIVGGVAAANCGYMSQCEYKGTLKSNADETGGIVGDNRYTGYIVKCKNSGKLGVVCSETKKSHNLSCGHVLAGIAGRSNGCIVSCTNTKYASVKASRKQCSVRMAGIAGSVTGSSAETRDGVGMTLVSDCTNEVSFNAFEGVSVAGICNSVSIDSVGMNDMDPTKYNGRAVLCGCVNKGKISYTERKDGEIPNVRAGGIIAIITSTIGKVSVLNCKSIGKMTTSIQTDWEPHRAGGLVGDSSLSVNGSIELLGCINQSGIPYHCFGLAYGTDMYAYDIYGPHTISETYTSPTDKLKSTSLAIKYNETKKITASKGKIKRVYSSEPMIVKVTGNTKVKGVMPGKATLYVVFDDGQVKSCKVKVTGKINTLKVKLSKTSYKYNGKSKKPDVLLYGNNRVLIRGRDYTATYKNNKQAGKATVIIKGKGNWTGTIKKQFWIKK